MKLLYVFFLKGVREGFQAIHGAVVIGQVDINFHAVLLKGGSDWNGDSLSGLVRMLQRRVSVLNSMRNLLQFVRE